MSRYDDEYDDNEDEYEDDEIDGEDGIRRSTSNPFSANRTSSVRGAGLPQPQQRPPNNADGSTPSPIRSGGTGSGGSGSSGGGSLYPNRPGNTGGGSGSSLPNRPSAPPGGNSGSGSGVQPFQRSSPLGRNPNDRDDERGGGGVPNRTLGGGGGLNDRRDERTSGSGGSPGGTGSFGSRLGGGGNNDRDRQDERTSRLTGGLGGMTSRIGGDDKKDQNANKPSGGGLGGLTSRFGGDDKKDQNANKSGGGGLGGLTSRFGGGDKKDNAPNANKPSGGGLGGLTSRFGGDDKKNDRSSGGGGGLGGLTSRFGGGDKKDDAPSGGMGGMGSSSGLGGNRPGQSSGSFGGGNRPGQSSSSYGAGSSLGGGNSLGGSSSSSSSRSTFGGGGTLGGSKPGGKQASPSLGDRLKGLNPFGGKEEARPAARSRTSKAPRVEEGGLTLDNKLDILGVVLLLGSLVLLLSSLSPTKGALTESINHGFSFLFGWGAVAVLLIVFAVGVWLILRHFGDEAPVISRVRLVGLGMLFLGLLVAAQYVDSFQYRVGANQDYLGTVKTVFLPISYELGRGGGWIGGEIYFQLLSNFGEIGGFMVVIGWLLVSLMLTLSLSASDLAMVVVSNARNLSDVMAQRRQRAAAQRAVKQQALAAAMQQISVTKPQDATLPAGNTAGALPAPAPSPSVAAATQAANAEAERRSIPITSAGRTSTMPFRTQQEPEYAGVGLASSTLGEPVPVSASVAGEAETQEKNRLLGGFGSRVRGALPTPKLSGGKLPFGRSAEDKERDDEKPSDKRAAEKAASLRGRLFSRENTTTAPDELTRKDVTPGSEPVRREHAGQPSRLGNIAGAAAGAVAGSLASMAASALSAGEAAPPEEKTAPHGRMAGDEKPATEEKTPRLSDLLGRPGGAGQTPGQAGTTGGVQPYQRPPLVKPETPAAHMPAATPAASTAPTPQSNAPIPDLQTRLRTLRETTEAEKPAETGRSNAPASTASPAFGKPSDPPFAIPQRQAAPEVGLPRRAPRNWMKPDTADVLSTGTDQEPDREMLVKRVHIIEETLASFGAPGRVVDVRTGPVVTQFGVEPDYVEGRGGKKNRVKVGAIAALDKDLQLALGAKAIRIEAPVPGKGYVGVEVPNEKPEIVHLRDVMEAPEFKRIKSPLGIALGQGVDGTPVTADLASMPHLLIAGTTGSGKSVCVNAIIASILLNNTPQQVKFVMVDPKRVELTQYNGIPHLIAPVVVDLERIVSVLKWVTREMDERYRKFSTAAARNIEDYNKHLPKTEEAMPYIVVIIDELADLMMLAPDDTERTITRIAALARATGIHLVIATQRPSVDVVTGLIKANFPARVAFAVAGNTDSRVILDQPGAEKLLGRGDMLYMSGDSPAPVRLQGVWVSDAEIGNLTRFWREQMSEADLIAASRPIGGSISTDGSSRGEGGVIMRNGGATKPAEAYWDEDEDDAYEDDELGDGEDEMYEQAVELVRRLNKASVSLLQRRLRIGYTRAARMIDTMEERGVVGPATEGSKPREVLPAR